MKRRTAWAILAALTLILFQFGCAPADPKIAHALYEALQAPFAVEASRDARLITAARLASMFQDPAVCVDALSRLEPPPWTRGFLEMRLRCYRRAGHRLTAVAEADMLQYLELDTPLGASIPSPPPLPRPAPDGGAPERAPQEPHAADAGDAGTSPEGGPR